MGHNRVVKKKNMKSNYICIRKEAVFGGGTGRRKHRGPPGAGGDYASDFARR